MPQFAEFRYPNALLMWDRLLMEARYLAFVRYLPSEFGKSALSLWDALKRGKGSAISESYKGMLDLLRKNRISELSE
jgi:hypothetical protein